MRFILPAALLASSLFAQSFEVATIKPTPPDNGGPIRVSMSGGPGTDDPARAVFTNLTLANLVTLGLGIDFNRLSAPDWARSAMFQIEAKVPEGATREQFIVMVKNLLIERFHLAYHAEKKEAATYDLVVAKNGPKFKEAAAEEAQPESPPPPRPPGSPQVDQEGYPVLPGGKGARTVNGHARIHQAQSLDQLARMVSGQVSAPVTNATGLTGRYEIALQWVQQSLKTNAADNDPGPSIFDALQEQLGLRLQPKKSMIDMTVIDHLDRTPTEN